MQSLFAIEKLLNNNFLVIENVERVRKNKRFSK